MLLALKFYENRDVSFELHFWVEFPPMFNGIQIGHSQKASSRESQLRYVPGGGGESTKLALEAGLEVLVLEKKRYSRIRALGGFHEVASCLWEKRRATQDFYTTREEQRHCCIINRNSGSCPH